jgi:hypothetical protein
VSTEQYGIKEKNGAWSVDNAIRLTEEVERRICEAIVAEDRRTPTDEVRIVTYDRRPKPLAQRLAQILEET